MSLYESIRDRQENISINDIGTAVVIGLGGIGSWVALDLALASNAIENLILIDDDKVELTNLNRTPFRLCDVSSYKVDAIKYLILERRAINVITQREKFKKELIDTYIRDYDNYAFEEVIIDCRDDVYKDIDYVNVKIYKLGYDGLSLTIDGKPQTTTVWGNSRGYNVVPSFLCPSQLIANLVVNDILVDKGCNDEGSDESDDRNRFNKILTFNTKFLLRDLYNFHSKKGKETQNVSV